MTYREAVALALRRAYLLPRLARPVALAPNVVMLPVTPLRIGPFARFDSRPWVVSPSKRKAAR